MKSRPNSISLPHLFTLCLLFTCLATHFPAFTQGFNNNEWIFGNCENGESNYISFGKGNTANVQKLPSNVLLGSFNSAIIIDPITGQPFFQTNGELVYDYSQSPIEGSAPGLNGNVNGTQQVATGFLEYDPEGNKLFYIFYTSPGGQLQYAVADMNALGQATGNERPLGEIISKDNAIGPASGAILVVKTSSSPSYLISFDAGQLRAQRLENTEGDFTISDNAAISSTPKFIVFNEETRQLIIVPEDGNEPIFIIDFDTSNGSFGTPSPITQSGTGGEYGGAESSSDGSFVYYSAGNQLFRVPFDDLAADPELIPIETQGTPPVNIFAIYDIKVGPDGNLYYIYEEMDGGPQLIGRITNPEEIDLTSVEIEVDPFAGADFCGTVFPTFAPNADIDPAMDFTWEPTAPCANNPIQLTSLITPENYRPVSFNWEFNPPLTDEDGEPIDADYTQEHFLIPADAAQGTSLEVTLTVEYADGTTATQPHTIPLTENELEANFTPSDTTLCETCIDLAPLLEAQSGEEEGGGQGGQGGSGGQGNGDEYEYFWSNKRDEGWGPKGTNEVCKPGLYWALVREPGSSCYAYAEIRIKMWDLPDQANNIWYFGDGAGLDFNPDPANPEGPTPRPIEPPHNQNIPAGTTTISDQTGQVLFFTDGSSVWDLNGILMENGDNIGGDNTSSQSALAVPIPQEETLFYLFTTQATANGTNELKFSLVDIKAENPTGVGNVVTKDNFLFSPSTEHTAALDKGDTTWVMFHELGNNTFRAYPVSGQGIGVPVLSSVGSNHGFNSGVGSMKFSPDGEKVAVTITEGGCNKLEIFDFDQSTGEMTEYARVDLACDGEIYGLEFSESSERVLVSYRNGGPGIEEFVIKAVENNDPDATTCPTCFDDAADRTAIEACIVATKKQLSDTQGLDLGALQIGPNGQIYVAVVGSNKIGQINVGSGCVATSTFTQNGVAPMLGTTNLGLPSFVQNSGSSIPEPSLSAPSRLCIDPELGAEAVLNGAGESDIDSYFWTITHEDGTVIYDGGGPGENFQEHNQIFDRAGIYTVDLRVDRCAEVNYYNASTEILVDAPPVLTLADDVTLCADSPVTLTAIDGYDPAEGLYDFEWRNAAGFQIGDENSNTITVTEESIYTVNVSYRLPTGLSDDEALLYETCPATKDVFVGPAFKFDLIQDAEKVCYEETSVTFAPDTPISGEWFYTLNGDPARTSLGEFFELELYITNLPGPGDYEIIFVTEDPILEGCVVEKKLDLKVNELPLLTALQTTPAPDCTTADGSFEITMLADAQTVTVLETGDVFTNKNSGDLFSLTDLLPGIYTIEALNSFGCTYTITVAVENENPPTGFEYTVTATDEVCGSPTGVNDGFLTITFAPGLQTGIYKATRQGDGLVFSETFTNVGSLDILVPHGEYSIEIQYPTNCGIPDPVLYTIEQKYEVVFSVPSNFTACESFTFAPTSPDPSLIYTITGSVTGSIPADTNGEFTLTQSDTYIVRGIDPTGINCPKKETIVANITQPIDFDISLLPINCQVGVEYEAILHNVSPADVNFLWKDAQGVILGRRQTFVPSSSGAYTLDVQPKAGGLCPTPPIPFTAVVISQKVDVALDIVPFCVGQTSTTITIDADLTNVNQIQWFYTSSGSTSTQLSFTTPIIDVTEEGTYEAVLIGGGDCPIGRAKGQVIKSTIIAPVVPDGFTICAVEGVSQTISPGVYDNYSWKLNGAEVSTDSTFTPKKGGLYELTVSDNVGCEYISTIDVVVDCSLKITFPTGVVLNDPNRNFILYANEYIDDVEVFIYNRWGGLIFYCEHENIEPSQSFCPWNGEYNGQFVPNGTYAVVVKFSSINQNKTEKVTRAITIIQ